MDNLDQFIGQEHIKADLNVLIEHSKITDEVPNHIVFQGPPGCGKTTLAKLLGKELGYGVHTWFGGGVEPNDIQVMLEVILYSTKRVIIFIDELHAMRPKVAEFLLLPMESFTSGTIELPKFILAAATTDYGRVIKPLRDRFTYQYTLKPYSLENIVKILTDLKCPKEVATFIAQRSRFTPRLAKQFLLRIIKEWEVRKSKSNCMFDTELCDEIFTRNEIDEFGLTTTDREILQLLYENNSHDLSLRSRPSGVDAICTALNINRRAYLDLHEPYLLQMRFIRREPRGRMLNGKAVNDVLKIQKTIKPAEIGSDTSAKITSILSDMKDWS